MPAQLLQLCPTLCDPMDYNLPGSSVHGILQARILKWAAMPSSRGSPRPRDQSRVSWVSCTGRWVLSTSATWEVPLYRAALQLDLFPPPVHSGTLSLRKLDVSLVRACVLCPGSSQDASVRDDQPPLVLPWPMRVRSLETPSYG